MKILSHIDTGVLSLFDRTAAAVQQATGFHCFHLARGVVLIQFAMTLWMLLPFGDQTPLILVVLSGALALSVGSRSYLAEKHCPPGRLGFQFRNPWSRQGVQVTTRLLFLLGLVPFSLFLWLSQGWHWSGPTLMIFMVISNYLLACTPKPPQPKSSVAHASS